jgi:predicted ester cyclase
MTARETLTAFAHRYTAAWCSQNAASVASFFAPGGSLQVNDGAPAVGRDAITAVAQGFMTAFPDLRVLMDDLVVQGDSVTYRWTLVGASTGPGGTGRAVRISGFEEWSIGADGLIARSLGHFDSEDYQRQLEGGASAG